jgi:subtilase family serine protease
VPKLRLDPLEVRLVPASPRHGGGVTNPTPVGLTPAEVRHAYGFDQIPGLTGGYDATAGAGQTIAVVMAGDHPSIQSDLAVFSQTFGLPTPAFVKLNQKGSAAGPWPKVNASWAGEIALDVEWAHAVAPAANVVLVEANSANLSDLAAAIDTARTYPGVSAVSMSWGLLQGTGMGAYESLFTTPAGHTPVTFVACAMDNGVAYPNNLYWPAVSPRVLAVGGTSLTLTPDGDYGTETAWRYGTGGYTTWFGQPAYQQGVVTQTSAYRAVPDVAYHADNSGRGFAVYSTVAMNRQTGWFNASGTSAGAPQWAGLVALANQQRAAAGLPTLDGASQVLPGLYALAGQSQSTYYHDVTTGVNGRYAAGPGYDLVTGLGTPKADALVPVLAALTGSGAAVAFPPPETGVAFATTTFAIGGGLTAAGPTTANEDGHPWRPDPAPVAASGEPAVAASRGQPAFAAPPASGHALTKDGYLEAEW